MKLKYLVIVVLFISSIFSVQAQNNALFNKLEDNDKVTVVYISKSLLKMAGSNVNSTKANIGGLINKLDQLEIYSTEDLLTARTMNAEASKYIKNNTYESLMKVKDGSDRIDFLITKDNGKKDQIKEFIMFIAGEKESTIIRLLGTFTMEDIQKVMDDNK